MWDSRAELAEPRCLADARSVLMRALDRAVKSAAAERLWIAACLIVTCAMYWPVLRFGFVFDDEGQILANPNVHTWDGLQRAFAEHVWEFDPNRAHGGRYYRPLFVVLLTCCYAAFGPHAFGYHALQLLLHGVAGVLLWRLGVRLGLAPAARCFAAAVFLLHPLQIQAVAWISAISDPLLALFALSALLLVLRGGHAALVLALLAFAAALLTLERGVALCVPWLLFVYARTPERRVLVTHAGRLATVIGGVAWLRSTQIGPSLNAGADVVLSTLWTAPSVLYRYLQNLVAPFELSMAYPETFVLTPSFANWVLPLLLVLLLAAGLLWASRGDKRRVLLIACSAALFAPAACVGLLPGALLVQDRYLYLPLAFFALWLGDQAFPAQPGARRRWVAAALGVWAVALFALHRGNRDYFQDNLSLYARAVELAPYNALFGMNLALEAKTRGLAPPDCALLERAAGQVAIDPRRGEPVLVQFNLGNCLREHGQRGEALAAFEAAYAGSSQQLLAAGVNRAVLLAELGRAAEAMDAARELVQRHPHEPAAFKLFGMLAAERGDMRAAERALQRALSLAPDAKDTAQLLERLAAQRERLRGQAF